MKTHLLAAILIVTLSPIAASDNTLEGDRTIDCSIYAMDYIDCSPDWCCSGDNDFNVTVGEMESVTLTITWTPQSEHATRFQARIVGNSDCTDTSNTSCYDVRVDGESPLSLTLHGVAASNDTIYAGVSLDDNCDQLDAGGETVEQAIFRPIESCQEGKFFQAAFNQSFHYQWTLVPG